MSEKKNVYERIVAELKTLIELGGLAQGERLPSVRTYAVERKVNPNTVAKAYAELENEGYIRLIPKKGGYVCFGGEATPRGGELRQRLEEWKAAGVTREELLAALENVYGGEV